jgi:hypothetical protein
MKIYILKGRAGNYEDVCEYNIGAFFNKFKADEMKLEAYKQRDLYIGEDKLLWEKCDEEEYENIEQYEKDTKIKKGEICTIDNLDWDIYEGTPPNYFIEELEVY